MNKFLLFLSALALCISTAFTDPALGATTPNSIITAQTPNRGIVQFLQGTDTAGTYKTLYTGGAAGSKIVAIIATSNDASVAHLVTCQLVNGGVKYGGVAVNVPINSGFANVTPQVNLMANINWIGLPVDSDGNPYLYLASASDTIQCTFATALTSTDVINIIAIAADF